MGILSEAMANFDKPAFRGMSSYIIAKYGQAGLLDVISAEYPWLRVRSVRPSYTRTDMLKVFDARFLEIYEANNTILTPEEVAENILIELGL